MSLRIDVKTRGGCWPRLSALVWGWGPGRHRSSALRNAAPGLVVTMVQATACRGASLRILLRAMGPPPHEHARHAKSQARFLSSMMTPRSWGE